jgi:hypothetical protein
MDFSPPAHDAPPPVDHMTGLQETYIRESLPPPPKAPRAALKPPPAKKVVINMPGARKRAKPNPKPEPGSDRDVAVARSKLLEYGKSDILGPYLQKRGHALTDTKVNKLNFAQCTYELESIEVSLCNKGNKEIVDAGILGAMDMIEKQVAQRSRWNVQGTTEKCFKNEHWLFLLERVRLKHSLGIGKLDPVTELSLVTFQTAGMMHIENTARLPTQPTTDLETPIQFDDE